MLGKRPDEKAEHFIVGTYISFIVLEHTYMNSGEQILQTKPFHEHDPCVYECQKQTWPEYMRSLNSNTDRAAGLERPPIYT